MASGSTLGSENGTSRVTTACVQAAEPGSGTSSTSIPAALNQPILVATANGVAAEDTVLAHQPTRSLLCAGAWTATARVAATSSETRSERVVRSFLLSR